MAEQWDLEEEEVWSVKSSSDDSNIIISSPTNEYMMMTRRRFNNNNNNINIRPSQPPPQRIKSSTNEVMVQYSSAPMNIPAPNWSRIYRKTTSKRLTHKEDRSDDHDHHGFEDDDDDEDMVVPPHEFLARKLARSQISSFSMCEGIGRTLKGRDLSKVRNSILIQTGFLEQ